MSVKTIEIEEPKTRTVNVPDQRGRMLTFEVPDETPEQRAERFQFAAVEFRKGAKLESICTMSFSAALKSKRPGKHITGLRAWVDVHNGLLRIKPLIVDRVMETESFYNDLPKWAEYSSFVKVTAAAD